MTRRSTRTRDEQIDKATKAAYYGSRRPRPPKILQVPRFDAPLEGTGPMRPVLVPYPMKPLSWEEARETGKAYGRVLDGFPKYDREFEKRQRDYHVKRAELKQQHLKAAERYKKDPRGMWWLNKLADAIDRRKTITIPSHSRRYEPKETTPQPAASE